MSVTYLDELTAPLGAEEFLAQVYGRTFRVFPGDPDRFGKVFGWPDLNEILATHRLSDSQLQLVRGGKMVHHSAYTTNETRHGAHWQRLRPQRLGAHLRAGGTLRLREVDQIHRGVGELAAALERALRERVRVNAYANCGAADSSTVHYDDHDIFVLQVAGAKQWRLYGLAQPLPLPDDAAHPTLACADRVTDPVAELALGQGQALYLPRGWWHAAQSVEGPSLHVTVGIFRATGTDLLNWLVGRLREHDVLRADVPRGHGEAAQREYLVRIQELVTAELAEPDVLARMLADRDAREPVDLGFTFPIAASGSPALPPGEPIRVRLLARRAVLERDGDSVVVRAGGQAHRYDAHLAPMLEPLVAGRTMTISEMTAACADTVDEAEIRTLVAALITAGLADTVP